MPVSKRRTPKRDRRRGPARKGSAAQPRPAEAPGALAERLAEALVVDFCRQDPGGTIGVSWGGEAVPVVYRLPRQAARQLWPLLRPGDPPADQWGLAARFLAAAVQAWGLRRGGAPVPHTEAAIRALEAGRALATARAIARDVAPRLAAYAQQRGIPFEIAATAGDG